MKLQTAIKPRRDGTVIVQGLDSKPYVFLPDDAGDLVCDIAHEPTVAHLLALDLFMPADEADFARALALTTSQTDPDDDDEDPVFSEGNGLPIEANTPPVVTAAPPAPAAPSKEQRKAAARAAAAPQKNAGAK